MMRSAMSRRSRATAGFTLVELLVALALAAIISVSIMFISTQAREAYEQTVSRVDEQQLAANGKRFVTAAEATPEHISTSNQKIDLALGCVVCVGQTLQKLGDFVPAT